MCRWWSADVRGFWFRCTDTGVISPPQRYLPSSEPTYPATYCRYLPAGLGQRFRQPAEPHPKAASLRSPSGHWRTASRTQTPILRSLGWLDMEDVVSERDCIRAFPALNDPDTPRAVRRLFIQRRDTASRDTRLARSDQLTCLELDSPPPNVLLHTAPPTLGSRSLRLFCRARQSGSSKSN